MKKIINTGDTFGKLTILKEVDKFVQPSGQTQRGFWCVCECGVGTKVRLSHLVHNRVTSCGCVSGERHGMTGKPLYNTWRGMKNRCVGNGNRSHIYKDRGIKVCEEWNVSFFAFARWALSNGFWPGLQIDRIDNEKGYSPANCRWVTPRQNCNNRRNTQMIKYNGELHPITEIVETKGLTSSIAAIRGRIKRGWDSQKAIDTPIRKGNYIK